MWTSPLILALVAARLISIDALDNGLGQRPQMGWNTWNRFGCDISEELIISSAQCILDKGLLQLGYNYISLDDCWHAESRDPHTNAPRADPLRFPNGMASLTDKLHNMGFKAGLYSNAGTLTCARRFGSLGFEKIDAETYANWGFDYLKYDNCYNEGQSGTPKLSYDRYKAMSVALNNTGRPFWLALCNWGEDGVWNWGSTVANSWRMSGDVYATYDKPDSRCPCENSHEPCQLAGVHCSVMNIAEKASGIVHKAKAGSWADLDGLEVGNDGLTYEEQKTQFSIWAITKSAFMLGNDVTAMSEETLSIISNKDVIAVNQDLHGSSGYRVWRSEYPDGGNAQLWKGKLGNGEYAMLIVNTATKRREICVDLSDFFSDEGGQRKSERFDFKDLWSKDVQSNVHGRPCFEVLPHGVRMFKLTPNTSSKSSQSRLVVQLQA